MKAARTFPPLLLAASLLAAGCTEQLLTGAESGFNQSLQPLPAEEPPFLSDPQSSSEPDSASLTGRGIGTIGSGG